MKLIISTELKNRLERWTTEQVLIWVNQTFASKVVLTSSFQTQSMPLLHMISMFCPDMKVLFIDTGYHFPETLAFRDTLLQSMNLNVRTIQGELSQQEFENNFGNLYQADPDSCCFLKKVIPLKKALSDYKAWITGIRREQTEVRKHANIIEASGDLVKINPLINWTQAQIDRYIAKHNLPRHPLESEGFQSIGCAPCTKAVVEEERNRRSGRWYGFSKTECGIHTMSRGIDGYASKVTEI
jgi:phosphoadenosine phosphosulfate reductase